MRTLGVVVILITAAACGDDERPPADAPVLPGADAPVAAPDANGGGDPDAGGGLTGDEYDEPSDFAALLDCVPGEIGAANLDQYAGVLHGNGVVDVGGFPLSLSSVLKVPGTGSSGEPLVQGSPGTIEPTADGVFFRVSLDDGSGRYVFAFYACAVDDDGSLWGHAAECADDYADWFGTPCVVGTQNAYPIRRWDATPASGLALLGEHGAAWPEEAITTNVRVKDGLAYVSRIADGLRIVDVSDPANMTDVGFAPGGYANDLKLVERPTDGRLFALVAETDGVHVIDVEDPAATSEVAVFPAAPLPSDNAVHTLFVETVGGATWAYTTEYRLERVGIYDVTDPATPVPLGAYDVTGAGFSSPHDLYVEERVLYLNDLGAGFVIVDTSDPASPLLLGQLDDAQLAGHSSWVTTVGGCKVAIVGGEGWATHLATIGVDEACPADWLQVLDEWETRPEVSVHNIMAAGNLAYVAWYQDGVRVFDVSDPADLQLDAWFNTWDAALPGTGQLFYDGAIGLDLDLAADRMYVADMRRGLLVLDLSP